jgi:hypothetical protein
VHRIRRRTASLRAPLRGALAVAVAAVSAAKTLMAQRLVGAVASASGVTARRGHVAASTQYRVSVGTALRVSANSASQGSSDARRLLTLRFRADAGERSLVTAHVVAYQPRGTPDRYLMAAMSLTCWPRHGGVVGSGSTQNLTRGRTTALDMRFVHVAQRSGVVGCVVRGYGSRPRPTYGGPTTNYWYAWYGSRLTAGAPQPAWGSTRGSGALSRVVQRGGALRTLPRRTHSLGPPPRPSVQRPQGHHVLELGRVRTKAVIDRVYRVTPEVHHRMIHAMGVLRPSRAAECDRRYTVSTVLRGVGGAPFVVHASSERTTVVS